MDSWEWNKIAGAVLGTLLFVLAIRIASESLFEVEKPEKAGYKVEGVVEATDNGTTATPVAETVPDFGTVLASADVAAGEKVAGRCAQCHTWTKDGPNKIGPNLYGIIGRPRASHPGFSYSSAMMSNKAPWTFEELFHYLKSPAAMVPGTKMSFAGLRSEADRINLLAYMRSWADTPAALPPPKGK